MLFGQNKPLPVQSRQRLYFFYFRSGCPTRPCVMSLPLFAAEELDAVARKATRAPSDQSYRYAAEYHAREQEFPDAHFDRGFHENGIALKISPSARTVLADAHALRTNAQHKVIMRQRDLVLKLRFYRPCNVVLKERIAVRLFNRVSVSTLFAAALPDPPRKPLAQADRCAPER